MLNLTLTRIRRLRRPTGASQPLPENCTPEHMFDRLIEETEELRRLCGFESDLFDATRQLRAC